MHTIHSNINTHKCTHIHMQAHNSRKHDHVHSCTPTCKYTIHLQRQLLMPCDQFLSDQDWCTLQIRTFGQIQPTSEVSWFINCDLEEWKRMKKTVSALVILPNMFQSLKLIFTASFDRIEEELGEQAKFVGENFRTPWAS